MKSYSHLHPDTAKVLLISPQERCEYLRTLRFVPYPAGLAALRWLRHLKAAEYGRDRPRSMHLIGAAGMGKSRLLKHHAQLHGQDERDTEGHRAKPVVLIEMRNGDYKALCTDLIAACLLDFRPTRPGNYLDRVVPVLRESGVRQILIDEAGHLLLGGKHSQQQCLALLKTITNQGITLCIATTENMKPVLAADEQLSSRFMQVRLPHWTESQELRQFLAGIESQLPLPEPSRLDQVKVVRWLVSQGYTITSALVDLLRDVAMVAIRTGHTHITLELIKEVAEAIMPPDTGA